MHNKHSLNLQKMSLQGLPKNNRLSCISFCIPAQCKYSYTTPAINNMLISLGYKLDFVTIFVPCTSIKEFKTIIFKIINEIIILFCCVEFVYKQVIDINNSGFVIETLNIY